MTHPTSPPATPSHRHRHRLSLQPAVTTCRDPGDAEHSRRVVSSPKFPVGSTVRFVCDKGYVLAGAGLLTCHDRASGGPKWSDRLPKCIRESGILSAHPHGRWHAAGADTTPSPTAEAYEPCHNPGVPAGGRQSPERRLYPAGSTLRFSCTAGRALLGEGNLRCLPGHPSRWSGSPPICKAGEQNPLALCDSVFPPRLPLTLGCFSPP